MSVSPIWRTPFLEDRHRALADRLLAWDIPEVDHDPEDFDPPVRLMLRAMAAEGLLDLIIPAPGQSPMSVDLRAICLVREVLAYRSGGLADTSFVMQGIGTAAIWLSGSEATAGTYLARARRGETIAAFALTEPETGSDVANITTSATRDGDDYILNGAKTFISNAGIADHYLIVARTGEAPGARGLSAFLVDADTPGLATEKQRYIAAHAGGSLALHDVRVPASRLIGTPGGGFKLAMATFDIFRASVGAAAIGFGRRALDEALDRTRHRQLFGKRMADMDGVQTKLAEMATEIEAAGLLVYRAAWAKDSTGQRCTREVSMAKLIATESAQNVIDAAVQLFGGAGVTHGSVVERLYREVRPMRIYEGASEVQKLVIAREMLKD
ncbi:MAG: acyl-CoA dehydrogenase [Sphingomonas bacterium]|uniref:acyl-CoA dehydrogenase family protein n=1 Tax=Sphingomonas bacterium TaxID=1895847 RepID=UPI002628B800|nr:acyl-CoA dehydrogenase family protein [Sphingomonas bacterium]MDB5703822.1 acyl-CoA dehydrogenase [Sphingomonas bacterium]